MKKSFKLKDHSYSLGPFLRCPYPEIVESCGLMGFDFAVADLEHTPLSPKDLYPLLLAAENRGMDLIVRIPIKAEEYFKWCLDLGAKIIQVPHVQSREDAEYAVAQSYFSPQGERGVCRFGRAAQFSAQDKHEYFAAANERTKLILQIEGKKGVDQIEEILKVKGIDTLFIGPYDLSQSLGVPGQIWEKPVVQAMKEIIRLCKDRKVKVGTFTDTPEGIPFWVNEGVELIEYATDLHLFMQGVRQLQEQI